MENASKALLIAGGVLIAMLIISIAVFLFIHFRDVGSSYDRNMRDKRYRKIQFKFHKI